MWLSVSMERDKNGANSGGRSQHRPEGVVTDLEEVHMNLFTFCVIARGQNYPLHIFWEVQLNKGIKELQQLWNPRVTQTVMINVTFRLIVFFTTIYIFMPNYYQSTGKSYDVLTKLKLVMFQVQRVLAPAWGHQAVGGAGGQGLIGRRCSFLKSDPICFLWHK